MAVYGIAFVEERSAKKFQVVQRNGLSSLKSYSYRIFPFKYDISVLKLTHVHNFSKIGQKILKDLEFRPQAIAKTA